MYEFEEYNRINKMPEQGNGTASTLSWIDDNGNIYEMNPRPEMGIGYGIERGPCGIPRNPLLASEFVGLEYTFYGRRYCSSKLDDCGKCPLNPNVKEVR